MNIFITGLFKSKKLKRVLLSLLFLFISFIILDTAFPLNPDIKYSRVVRSSEGKILSTFLSSDDKWRFYYTNDNISNTFKQSILFKEDKYYYYHFGFNPISIIRAAYLNIVSGRIEYGASTITMQTARMLEPKERNLINKIIELFRSIQLEVHHSKDEILNIYLNKIPFGGNIEGVGAASTLYFGKNPDMLSLAESAALAVIPNNPKFLSIQNSNELINTRKNHFLKYLKVSEEFELQQIKDALNEFVKPERNNVHRVAPQLCIRLINENKGNTEINTNINYTIQTNAEQILKNFSAYWKLYGVNNSAAFIINNLTNEVSAYVGSNDFTSRLAGQVDGVRAVRSPGSTLKPFLYALMIDKGELTPMLSLLDVPILNNDYTPGNIDGKFNGRVTAEFALAQSLNVPAVNLLERFGVNNFSEKLINAGFVNLINQKRKLGLSMILGGCGVSLEELTILFSIFAREGILSKPKFLNNSITSAQAILSPESAYIITEILSKIQRPDYPQNYVSAKNAPLISWKTGTSQGKRDAWAIGYNRNYTIGVWVGNFTGKPNSTISGSNLAVPLLFELFNNLNLEDKRSSIPKPDNLHIRKVDGTTGLLPSELSVSVVDDYYIPGVSFSKQTEHLKKVYVSNDETISYCVDCMPDAAFKQLVYEVPEIELRLFYKSQRMNFREIPPHNPKCVTYQNKEQIVIIHPKDRNEYFLENNSDNSIILNAKSSSGMSKKIYWFVNDSFIGISKDGEGFDWQPKLAGNYKITCVSSDNSKQEINIKVKIY